jgi:hypothetical protein
MSEFLNRISKYSHIISKVGFEHYFVFILTPKVPRGQILAFAVLEHVAVIRRCDMIF